MSLNSEMAYRLQGSFEHEANRALDVVSADIARNWALFADAFHGMNKQGDLVRVAKSLVEAVKKADVDTLDVVAAVLQVEQVLKMIELEAAQGVQRMHTTGAA